MAQFLGKRPEILLNFLGFSELPLLKFSSSWTLLLVSEYLERAVKEFEDGAENMQSLIANVDLNK